MGTTIRRRKRGRMGEAPEFGGARAGAGGGGARGQLDPQTMKEIYAFGNQYGNMQNPAWRAYVSKTGGW